MVLEQYLNLLKQSFEALPLELAFRVLCSKLLLRGEAQQVNRVLSAFAKAYMQSRTGTPPCHTQPDHLLTTIELLEMVVTSMVMLNTILHNPTAREAMNAHGPVWKRQWVRSTAEALGPQKEWETYLDQLYNSIEMHPIRLPDTEQTNPRPILRSDSRSSRSSVYTSSSSIYSSSSKSSIMSQAKKWGMGILGQSRTTPQVQVSFPTGKTEVLMSGILIKKNYTAPDGTKAKNRTWVKYWCNVWLEIGQGTVLEPGRFELHMHRIVDGRPSEKEMDKLMNLTDIIQPQDEWEPTAEAESPTASGYMEMSGLKKSPSMESTVNRKPPRPVALPPLPNATSKWIYKQPEVLPLLHSLATPLPGSGYSASRPHVFSLLGFDGSSTLFQVSTAAMLRDWVSLLNKSVALRSKRVLRGGVSNVEYGWNHLMPQNDQWDPSRLRLLPKEVVARWKIGVWQSPELAHVVGLQSVEKQFEDMQAQIDAVEKELSIHTPLRVALEKQVLFSRFTNRASIKDQAIWVLCCRIGPRRTTVLPWSIASTINISKCCKRDDCFWIVSLMWIRRMKSGDDEERINKFEIC
jgi:hypothetical protein